MGAIIFSSLLTALPEVVNVSDGYAEAHADEHDGCHRPGFSEELVDAGAIWAVQFVDCTPKDALKISAHPHELQCHSCLSR